MNPKFDFPVITRHDMETSEAVREEFREADVILSACPKTGREGARVFFGEHHLRRIVLNNQGEHLEVVRVVCDEATDDPEFFTAAVHVLKNQSAGGAR